MSRPTPRGFALLTVMWVLVATAAVTTVAVTGGRAHFNAARNRITSERAHWRADDCLQRARFAIDTLLKADPHPAAPTIVWQTLDAGMTSMEYLFPADCSISLEAAGTRLDINAATSEQLSALLAMAAPAGTSEAVVQALLDWRDTDDVLRANGAEHPWYEAANRPPPRNGALASLEELQWVRGWEASAQLAGLLTVEPGRISLATAAPTVLMTVPGITDEAAEALLQRRLAGRPVREIIEILPALSRTAADTLLAAFQSIVALTVAEPDAWIVTSRVVLGEPAITTISEIRLVREDRRAVETRRRVW